MTFGVRTSSGSAEDLADDAAAREIRVTVSDVTDAVSDSNDERDLNITFSFKISGRRGGSRSPLTTGHALPQWPALPQMRHWLR